MGVEEEIGLTIMGVRASFLTVVEAFWTAFFSSCGLSPSVASYMIIGLRMRCERREIMIIMSD